MTIRKTISILSLALGLIALSGSLDYSGTAHARDNNMGGITQDMQDMPRMRGTTNADRQAAAKRIKESKQGVEASKADTQGSQNKKEQ